MFDTLTDSRILGMGDVLTLIEKAEEAASEKDQAAMEAGMHAVEFGFDDFLKQLPDAAQDGPAQANDSDGLRDLCDALPLSSTNHRLCLLAVPVLRRSALAVGIQNHDVVVNRVVDLHVHLRDPQTYRLAGLRGSVFGLVVVDGYLGGGPKARFRIFRNA